MSSWKSNCTRPYHVPKDLEPQVLTMKSDFQQFQELRDSLLPALLDSSLTNLEPGGNKAHTLAVQAKLL
ncbi:hypothetical protein [Streptomyces sp. MMBL 11-3]|uniref:hypothetical protein n=1 Tax=Streptomyces sp. MMBL 11-3 TaxID=3382639 RepID=UPI0039B4DE35